MYFGAAHMSESHLRAAHNTEDDAAGESLLLPEMAVGGGHERRRRAGCCVLAGGAAAVLLALCAWGTERGPGHSRMPSRSLIAMSESGAAGGHMPPLLPRGWSATWDAKAHRFYYYNTATSETTWDSPEAMSTRHEEMIYNKLKQGGGEDAQLATGDCAALDPQDLEAVKACWQERGKREMQEAKNAAFDAAVKETYDNVDVAKGRAMHKTYHGAVGGGEGYWPGEPPPFPTPGGVENQGRDAAIAENYDKYDPAHGVAIPKSSSESRWNQFWKRR
jgi:hypothetical protein